MDEWCAIVQKLSIGVVYYLSFVSASLMVDERIFCSQSLIIMVKYRSPYLAQKRESRLIQFVSVCSAYSGFAVKQ